MLMNANYVIEATEIQVFQSKTGCILPGPKEAVFTCNFEENDYTVHIIQAGGRCTQISAKSKSTVNKLYRLFCLLDEYHALFDGEFFPVAELSFSGTSENDLKDAAKNLISRRLNTYKSVDFVQGGWVKLADSFPFLTETYFQKWLAISKELDIVHAMFLYCTADTGVPVDLRCAHLIELFEPVSELIGLYDPFFPSLSPGNKNSPLRLCLDTVFSRFALEIFGKEYSTDKDRFLTLLVGSRNRIMHIKRKLGQEKFLSGQESLLYCVKLEMLYRRIILELLGVEYQLYKPTLESCILVWEKYEKIFDNFLATKMK